MIREIRRLTVLEIQITGAFGYQFGPNLKKESEVEFWVDAAFR